MINPLFEGTRELARRFREERRGKSHPSSEEFLDAQRESPSYPAGIAREQWVALLDAMRNVRESEIDSMVNEWIEQLPALDPTLIPSTLPLAEDGERTVASAQVPAEDARYIDRRYRIVRVLGEGAFGKVFLVQDKLQNDHELALKLIKKEHTATSEALVRFKNEILLLRVLNHPGIPQIFNDGISEDGEFYYTMAYVAGRTLDDVIRKEAPLDPLRIVRITKQIIDVLEYAHARGAIHRDLKPGNIFLLHAGTPKEQVRVLDFGIAKVLSREGILEHAQTMNTEMPLGTPHYMSPEQVRGTEVDGRTDLYALGVILYQMCSGRFPFSGKTLMEILAARLERPATPLVDETTPAWLRDLVMKLLERERDARPDTTSIRLALDHLHGSHRELSKKLTWIGAAVVLIAGAVAWMAFGGKGKEPSNGGVVPSTGNEHAKVDPKTPAGEPTHDGKQPASSIQEPDKGKQEQSSPPAKDPAETPPKSGEVKTDGDKALENSARPSEAQDKQPAPTAPTPAPFSLDLLDPPNNRTLMIPAQQKSLSIKGKASRALASVKAGETEGTIDPSDPKRFEVLIPLTPAQTSGGNVDSDIAIVLVDEFEHGQHTQLLHVTRVAASIPRGCRAASDATIDERGRVTEVVHDKTGIKLALVDEGPGKPGFYLGIKEVMNREMSTSNTGFTWDEPVDLTLGSSPAVKINFDEALRFCENNQLRMASADEWDRAAALAGHVYPWGDDYVAGALNCSGTHDKFPKSAPAASFPQDKCGPFYDMAGNVSEWCVDAGGKPALRGGSYKLSPGACKLAARNNPPAQGTESIGFRVALSVEP